MATFTEAEQNLLIILLGYGSVPNTLTSEFKENKTEELIAAARNIIQELALIDTQLISARPDSMAMGVGNLKLSYRQHVAHLKSEGSRYLQELSNLLGVEIIYDKYRPRRVKISYW